MGLLAAIIATFVVLAIGKGIFCLFKNGCPLEEQNLIVETLTGLVATVIALIFALLK